MKVANAHPFDSCCSGRSCDFGGPGQTKKSGSSVQIKIYLYIYVCNVLSLSTINIIFKIKLYKMCICCLKRFF
jgi:hypothetical protein